MSRNSSFLPLALLAAAPALALAQSTLHTHVVPGATGHVAALGDLDGDGVADFALGAAGDGVAAFVRSGRFGNALFTIPEQSGALEHLDDAGDVDADGKRDVAVGFAGGAAVFSGQGGGPLLAVSDPAPALGGAFGHRAVGIGDVDGDGHGDLLVTAPIALGGGLARVYSGANGSLLRTIGPSVSGFAFGIDASDLGDVNLDGVPDFLVSSHREVQVVSGATGLTLRVHLGDPAAEFGAAIAGVADANFDGVPDVAIGSPRAGFGLDYGRVAVHSGATGQLLSEMSAGGPGARFGSSMDAMEPAQNGLSQLLVGAPGQVEPGNSAVGMAFLWQIAGNVGLFAWSEQLEDGTGTAVASLGDSNGDGHPDALVARQDGGAGGASQWTTRALSAETLGLVTDVIEVSLGTGGAQTMSIDGLEIVPFSYQPVSEVAAGKPYAIVGSASGIAPGLDLGLQHLPLNYDAYFLFSVVHAGDGFIENGLGTLDAEGRATARFVVPPVAAPALVGLALHHAAIVFDGPGLNSAIRGISNAAAIRFGF